VESTSAPPVHAEQTRQRADPVAAEPGGAAYGEGGAYAGHAIPAHPGTLPFGRVDAGSRQGWTVHLQRTAGNRATTDIVRRLLQRDVGDDLIPPNPYVIETAGGGSRTELPANPYVGENDPVTLTNPRFTGQARLAPIAAGRSVLSAADNGPAMSAVQQALIALGFEMVRHGQDGRFGDETRDAIGQFRARRSMTGDQLSARALGELDTSAPPPGASEEHYFDYERLFADGYLDVTIAIGYDEGGSHTDSLAAVRAWMTSHGFELVPAQAGRPMQFRLRRDVTYPTSHGTRMTREVIVRANVVTPGAGAARQFGQALAESEVTLYAGHARRGIGPDFDADTSPAENFVIGVASALHAAGRAIEPSAVEQHHYVINRVNDLEQMTARGEFNREQYRVWFFNACTTLAYFDEIRGGILPASMDRSSLDLMGTRDPMPLIAEMPETLAMLDGILRADTMEQITRAMTRAGIETIMAIPDSEISAADRRALLAPMQTILIHEGAGDNPVAPAP
jgi:peptidoglycan hydrolase-like protein with peptidoglycan-binding domain